MQAQSALIKEQTCCPFLYRGISLSYYYPSMSILANSSATALFCTATLCKYLCCYYSVHDYALAFSWICIQRVTDDYSRNHLARDTDSNPHSMSLKNGGDNTIALIFFFSRTPELLLCPYSTTFIIVPAYMFKPFSTVRATASGSTDHHPSLQANLYGHLVASWLPFSIIEQCFAEIIFNRILNTINQKSCCLTVDRNFPAPVARNIRPECQSIPNR
ncbi:uncharacterized protein EURHEDRAFT_137670 [Aspergillus ruber CBS 135680]|uniref:Uncharacterized protein n=1 Tax=Aspergillus ruber (strain CBS 135680) TaxID=1388766 RepID=A0A017S9Y1_ASPRC|nr:uncharacterized protein EURHEDRAFT_137670 [Aspergillus ruber CBS 135680]EYE93596.1 hypothetical protein EURHEDRAFT_137670 [Aspergillus ruber CBS 135680]